MIEGLNEWMTVYPYSHMWTYGERALHWSVILITRFTQVTHWMCSVVFCTVCSFAIFVVYHILEAYYSIDFTGLYVESNVSLCCPTWSRRGTVVWVYLWLFCLPCCQWVWCMLVYGRGWYAAFWRCVCMLVWLICRFSRAWMLCRYVCMCLYTVCMLMCVAVIVIEMYMLEEFGWNGYEFVNEHVYSQCQLCFAGGCFWLNFVAMVSFMLWSSCFHNIIVGLCLLCIEIWLSLML